MQGHKIERTKVHEYLWSLADRFGKIQIHQARLAEFFEVTRPTMSLIMGELIRDGRIKKVASRRRNVGVYTVREPASFPHPFDGQEVPGIGIERCVVCGELLQTGPHVVI